VLSRNQKGALAEMKIATEAVALGVPVLRPVQEHGRYDLALEIAGQLLRVQCKWGRINSEGSVIEVNLVSSWCTPSGYERRYYTEDEIDALGVYCAEVDRCYLLPSSMVAGRRAIWLRLNPPLNGQRACLNDASRFHLPGAVAQLEERRAGSAKARGSSPLSSTLTPELTRASQVGCHEFRNHFGYYLEQAAAGHEIEISRRGRPYARLVPAQPRLMAA
jgi:prevent-host-death family protein